MIEGSSQYRSRCRIYADILRAIQESEQAKVSYLLHKANLSHERLLNHLTKITALGLIEKRSDGETVYFVITQKGRKYLMEFAKVQEFGDAFGIDV
ncbi:MAG TPA: winged helix-turn-helix domain-containing protein [Methanomassiliicoccales archaeon]|jgi:predicted transcriptional regulator